MKGDVQPDHIPVNNFQLIVLGMPPIYFHQISGIEKELDTVDLPDRTSASGGTTKPVEFTAMHPMHHLVEEAALESWLAEGQDPVTPTYKKAATLIHLSLSGATLRTYSIVGLYTFNQKLPDLDKANEGDMASVKWSFKADDLLPV